MSAEVYQYRAGPEPEPEPPSADEPERPAGPGANPRPGVNERSFRRGLAAGIGLSARIAGRAEDLEGAVLLLVRALSQAESLKSSDEYIRNIGVEIERRVLRGR